MKNRKWLKIYSGDSSISVGIYPDDEDLITIEADDDSKYGGYVQTKMSISEAEDFIRFIQGLIADLKQDKE